MDSVKRMMQHQARKNYKKGRFLYNMICLYALSGLACSLFCSYSFWFSSLSCYMKQFLFIHLPYIWSSFSNPKCLFIVANVIVVFLVGESNLVGSNSSSSPGDQYYDEYVERSRRLRGHVSSNLQEKKEEMNLIKDKESVYQVDEVKEVIKEEIEVEAEKDKAEKEEEEEEEEDEVGLPAEELNKRVEEFIARVNKQRWLEARSSVCCRH